MPFAAEHMLLLLMVRLMVPLPLGPSAYDTPPIDRSVRSARSVCSLWSVCHLD